MKKNYVYLAQSCTEIFDDVFIKCLKIGRTTDIKSRMEVFKSHNPSIKLLKIVEVDNPKRIEAYLHSIYGDKLLPNSGREWFEYSKDIIDNFEKDCKEAEKNYSIREYSEILRKGIIKFIYPNYIKCKEKLIKELEAAGLSDLIGDISDGLLTSLRSFEDKIWIHTPATIRDLISKVLFESGHPRKISMSDAGDSKIFKRNALICFNGVRKTFEMDEVLLKDMFLKEPNNIKTVENSVKAFVIDASDSAEIHRLTEKYTDVSIKKVCEVYNEEYKLD